MLTHNKREAMQLGMPIYEYQCPKCGLFEEIQKISESSLKECPKCSKPVTKLISQTSFHLKGGGWYKDGYANIPAKKKSKEVKKEPAKAKKETPKS